jgi:multicomponent K+:H+ antiporter subunit F
VIQTCIDITLAMFSLAMAMSLYRLLRGPGVTDRILALDTLYVNTIAILVLVGMRDGSTVYFEAAVVIAMLGFVGTVVLSKFVIRRDIIE